MKICFAQINPIVGDIEGNKELIISSIKSAKSKNADLIIFPEMTTIGYPPKDLISSKKLIEENIHSLNSIKNECEGITALIGFVNKVENKLYNCAALISDKKLVGIQEKTHLPNYDVFDEKRYFEKATESKIFQIHGKKIGITICEDVWQDGPVEELSRKGAELILNISASPFTKGKEKIRENEILSVKSKKNKVPIAYCNLIGGQDDLIFDGHSYYFNEKGEKLFEAPSFEEGLFIFDTNEKRKTEFKKINDTEQIYKALVLGIKDYFRKNGFKKTVLGLSGGIDSALTAALAVEALGKENVLGITMPSKYSSLGSIDDSKILAKNLGITIKEIPIKKAYDSYIETLSEEFKGTEPNVAEENIQARIRGNILMAISNKFGYLVLSTGNKSELAVGYCTLYGDMSGGLAVISDLPKVTVYEVSNYYNKLKGKEMIPKSIIDKEPSAELRPDQKDSDSLPVYEILDKILDLYVEEGFDKDDIIKKGFDKETVEKIVRLVKMNEYKRQQAALGIKVTSKAFGSGRRYPITNRWKQ